MTPTLLTGIALLAVAQSTTILVGEDRIITIAGLDSPVVEPHLSINPKDSNNLIAAAMIARSVLVVQVALSLVLLIGVSLLLLRLRSVLANP